MARAAAAAGRAIADANRRAARVIDSVKAFVRLRALRGYVVRDNDQSIRATPASTRELTVGANWSGH
jgi:hypothetical protein